MPRKARMTSALPKAEAIIQHLRTAGPQTSGQLLSKFSQCTASSLVCYLKQLVQDKLLATDTIVQRSKERFLYKLPGEALGLEDIYRKPLPAVSKTRIIIF